MRLVESAPFNSPSNTNFAGGKEYNGAGAHLFAEAVNMGYEMGSVGFVFFDSKKKFIDCYESELGAVCVGATCMCIEGKASRHLYERCCGDSI